MKNEHDLLNERLADSDNGLDVEIPKRTDKNSDPQEVAATPSASTSFDFVQWSAEGNEAFRPSGKRCETLPSGVYYVAHDSRGIYFQRKKVLTDDLIELDDNASVRVIRGIRTFWDSKREYTSRKIIYKRGILLWGPAGSGKTATLMLLTQDLLVNGGLVVVCEDPGLVNLGLEALRRIEPERPIIILLEDIDELIGRYGEHGILALLDGENQINNVVNIATTNYPERLGARIVNRPSRFDERIFIDMPSTFAREKYLRHATRNEWMPTEDLRRWVADTDGFSIAHLRELVVAVFCLKQDYVDVIERLSKMRVQPKSTREFGSSGDAGFAAPKQAVARIQSWLIEGPSSK
jgi:hypothetical protein